MIDPTRERRARLESAARIVLRPIGNPLPLGFLALAAATTLLSGLHLGWLETSDTQDVGLILIAFVFPLQLVASIFGFLARDTIAGTAMAVLAGTWLAVGLVDVTSAPGEPSDALGLLLIVAALALLVQAAATLGKLVAAALLLATALYFGTSAFLELTESGTWEDISGGIGLAVALLGLYAALALELEDAGLGPLPLGRRGPGARAMRGDLVDQAEGAESEAGVREQL